MATKSPRPKAAAGRKKVKPPVPPPEDKARVTPAYVSVEDLRGSLAAGKASWVVRKDLAPGTPAPRHLLGGDRSTFRSASETTPPDWAEAAAQLPGDPDLLQRRLELGLVPEPLIDAAREIVSLHKQSLAKAGTRPRPTGPTPRDRRPAASPKRGRK